jgi:hypothetical protein
VLAPGVTVPFLTSPIGVPTAPLFPTLTQPLGAGTFGTPIGSAFGVPIGTPIASAFGTPLGTTAFLPGHDADDDAAHRPDRPGVPAVARPVHARADVPDVRDDHQPVPERLDVLTTLPGEDPAARGE